jgi:DNA-binding CsgD family transcriptional regulator
MTKRGRRGEALCRRQLEVAQWVAQGLSNKEIGRRLKIRPDTVRAHLKVVFEKLGVRSRNEVMVHMMRMAASNPVSDEPSFLALLRVLPEASSVGIATPASVYEQLKAREIPVRNVTGVPQALITAAGPGGGVIKIICTTLDVIGLLEWKEEGRYRQLRIAPEKTLEQAIAAKLAALKDAEREDYQWLLLRCAIGAAGSAVELSTAHADLVINDQIL